MRVVQQNVERKAMTTDTAARTPLTDALAHEFEKDGNDMLRSDNYNTAKAHSFAVGCLKKMSKHARSLEAQLADKRAECERVNKQLEYVCSTLEITLKRAERAEQDAAQMRERLNHAVTELSRAALDENFDADACLDAIERIKGDFDKMGHTTDWHTLNDWYDKLCDACGLNNEDEINILPIAIERLKAAAIQSAAAERSAS